MIEPERFVAAVLAEISGELAALGLTRDDLAARSGIPRRSLTRYLSGERELSLGDLYAICIALDIAPAALIRRGEQRAAARDTRREALRALMESRSAEAPDDGEPSVDGAPAAG